MVSLRAFVIECLKFALLFVAEIRTNDGFQIVGCLYLGIGVADGRATVVFTLFSEKAEASDQSDDNCSG